MITNVGLISIYVELLEIHVEILLRFSEQLISWLFFRNEKISWLSDQFENQICHTGGLRGFSIRGGFKIRNSADSPGTTHQSHRDDSELLRIGCYMYQCFFTFRETKKKSPQ